MRNSKYALGLVASIAIVFLTITSPEENNSKASGGPEVRAVAGSSDVLLVPSVVDEWPGDQPDGQSGKHLVAVLAPPDASAVPPSPSAATTAMTAAVGGCTCDCDCQALERRISALEGRVAGLSAVRQAAAKTVVSGNCPDGQCPVPATVVRSTVVRSSPVVSNYQPRWQNYDGRTARQHAIEVHGFDPSLSDAQLAAQHDAYHDQYGGEPPTSGRSVARSRVVTSGYVTSSSNCPGGQCPAPSVSRSMSVQSRGGLLGFGILGRRR